MKRAHTIKAASRHRPAAARSPHESAAAQVAGAATYVDDIPEVRGTLHAAHPLARRTRRLRGVDVSAALAMPGVRGVVLAQRHPRRPMLAALPHDEPIFAIDTVQHVGQVIGLVVADTVMQARAPAQGGAWTSTPCRPC
jgi:xanthine dehydrogenase large subunit